MDLDAGDLATAERYIECAVATQYQIDVVGLETQPQLGRRTGYQIICCASPYTL